MYDDIAPIYQQIFPINKEFLKFIENVLPTPPASILDIGCGNGQYVDWFSRKGYQAVGIDSSAGMIEKAKRDYQGIFFQLGFTQMDQLSNTFDCIFCIGNSLSYLPKADTHQFLSDVIMHLNPTGFVVFQMVNWDTYHDQGRMCFPVLYLPNGWSFHRSYDPIDENTISFETELRKGIVVEQSWQAPLYPRYAQSFKNELTAAGYKTVKLFGDFNQGIFDPGSSPALVMVASAIA